LYDKKAALDSLNKMLGYNAPDKTEHSGEIKTTDLSAITTDELIKRAEAIKLIENSQK
jgi:hypothetical protein